MTTGAWRPTARATLQTEHDMGMTDLQAAIVRAYHAGRFSYAEALRRLLDGHVPVSDATRWLAPARGDAAPCDGARRGARARLDDETPK